MAYQQKMANGEIYGVRLNGMTAAYLGIIISFGVANIETRRQ